LQMELAKSEHLRLHHETNHTSAQDEMSALELELQSLREELVKAHMQLNHTSSGHEDLQGRLESQSARVKELEEANAGLREDVIRGQHDNEILQKDMSHLQHKLDNATQQQSLSEESLASSREKVCGLEVELRELRDALSLSKDDFARQSVEHASKLAASQEELLRLANDLSSSRHDVGEKSSELKAKSAELDSLRSMLVDAQKTIEFMTGEEKRYQSELMQANEEIQRLQVELTKSEHYRMSHETNHAASQEEVTALEGQISELRDALLKASRPPPPQSFPVVGSRSWEASSSEAFAVRFANRS